MTSSGVYRCKPPLGKPHGRTVPTLPQQPSGAVRSWERQARAGLPRASETYKGQI